MSPKTFLGYIGKVRLREGGGGGWKKRGLERRMYLLEVIFFENMRFWFGKIVVFGLTNTSKLVIIYSIEQ